MTTLNPTGGSAPSARALTELRRPRPYPAVSVTMATHRRKPDNAQDPVRLRNVVAEAKRRLEADPAVSRQARLEISGRLDKAAGEVDFSRLLNGLVILAAEGEHQVWQLPRETPERVVLSETYLTRNLVAAGIQARPYWVLAVATHRTTLWSGDSERLEEHRGRGFPYAAPGTDDWDVQRMERKGDTPSTYRDEDTRDYLRAVDAGISKVLEDQPRPLFLVGLPPALSLLDEVSPAARAAVGRLPIGGLTDGPGHALLRELRPALAEWARSEHEAAVRALTQARDRRALAAGLDETWTVVAEGRVEQLLVEEHFQQAARVNAGHLEVVPAESGPLDPAVREDVVDELIEQALDTCARVTFLPDDALAEHGRIAAVLRY